MLQPQLFRQGKRKVVAGFILSPNHRVVRSELGLGRSVSWWRRRTNLPSNRPFLVFCRVGLPGLPNLLHAYAGARLGGVQGFPVVADSLEPDDFLRALDG